MSVLDALIGARIDAVMTNDDKMNQMAIMVAGFKR